MVLTPCYLAKWDSMKKILTMFSMVFVVILMALGGSKDESEFVYADIFRDGGYVWLFRKVDLKMALHAVM